LNTREVEMSAFHPRVLAAQRAQLAARQAVLDAGAAAVGWKVGLGIPGAEALVGSEPVFGYLTSASRLRPGTSFDAGEVRKLQVDCELALELGRDVTGSADDAAVRHAIAGVGTALELCDVARPPDDFDSIVAENVFHRAFALGPARRPSSPAMPFVGRVWVNGELRYEAATNGMVERIIGIARLLQAVGERLRAGDWIICGAICGGLVERGVELEVEVGSLGRVRVRIAA
jgi:2-keto-4-pentenoate hydratase